MIDLPSRIVADNDYAQLFTGIRSSDQIKPVPLKGMSSTTKAFLAYACNDILPFSVSLKLLQDFHNSDTSVLAIDPQLVASFRDSFLRAHGDRMVETETEAIHSFHTVRNFGLDKLFKESQEKIMDDLLAINIDKNFFDHKVADNREDDKCGDVDSNVTVTFPVTYDNNPDDQLSFFGYFAVAVSLAELGIGARESAVQLLEREIQFQRDNLPPHPEDPSGATLCLDPKYLFANFAADAECQRVRETRFRYLQRVIILLRLEYVQNSILNRLSGGALDAARLRRSLTTIEDYDRAQSYFDPDRSQRESLLKTSHDDDERPALCAPKVRELDRKDIELFGRFNFAEIVAKNNILDFAGKHPNVVGAHPDAIPALDSFAEELARFDFRCPSRLAINIDPATPAIFLESLGSYWEAKGNNFGASSNDAAHFRAIERSQKDTIKALCSAKMAFSRARGLWGLFSEPATTDSRIPAALPPGESPGLGFFDEPRQTLKAELIQDQRADFPLLVQKEYDSTDQALGNYPAADIADACK